MNIFDAPKGKLDLTIAPKQVTNDKANLEATRRKQEAAFRGLPGDDQLAQKNRESKRRIQDLSTPIPIKKKGIESTPLSGGEYRFDDTKGTGFGQNPVVLSEGWDPAVTALKLASAFLAPSDNPVKHEENSKEANIGRFFVRPIAGALKGGSPLKQELTERTLGAVRGGVVGHSAGSSAGEAVQDNLIVGNTQGNPSGTAKNITNTGTVAGVLGGFAAPKSRLVGRAATGTAAANIGSQATTGRTLTGHLNQAPVTMGVSDKSLARQGLDAVKAEGDVSAFDVLEGKSPDDFVVSPTYERRLKNLMESDGVQKLVRGAGIDTPKLVPPKLVPPTPGTTDVADLARRFGRAGLTVGSAGLRQAMRIGRRGAEGVGGLLDAIRSNAQKSLANLPGLSK